ncbi:MAG: DUF86 domain-containing protein [Promethearchaeota archaeon]
MYLKEKISIKLARLEKNIRYLKKYSNINPEELESDWTLLSAIERNFQVAIEIVLDIGGMIISEEEQEKPESYRDVILMLGKIGVFSEEFAEKFAPAAGFRNILVHIYEEVQINLVCDFIRDYLSDFDLIAKYFVKYLENK